MTRRVPAQNAGNIALPAAQAGKKVGISKRKVEASTDGQKPGISKRKVLLEVTSNSKKTKKSDGTVPMDEEEENSSSHEEQLLKNNKFAGLPDEDQVAEAKENEVKQRKEKLPPFYVRQSAATIDFRAGLVELIKSGKVQGNIRLCQDGFKVLVQSRQHYQLVKDYLTENEAEYFTHDVAMDKPYKIVVRGLYDMPVEELAAELKVLKLDVLAVHKMSRRNKDIKYRDQLYLLHLAKGSTTLPELKAIRAVFNIIVSWERYRPVHRDVTQCFNCLGFGHGGKNCHLKRRCAKCGTDAHITSQCIQDSLVKCLNCNGEHSSTDRKCPKRAEFVKIRQQASTKNQPQRRRTPPALVEQNFPPLQPRRQVPNLAPLPLDPRKRAEMNQPRPGSSQEPRPSPPGFSQEPRPTQEPAVEENGNDLYTSTELLNIFKQMSAALRGCKTKTQQIEVLTSFVIQYGS